MIDDKIKQLLLMAERPRLESAILKKGGSLPEGKGMLDYKAMLRFFNSKLIKKLKNKGFDADLHSLSSWIRYQGKIRYAEGKYFYPELRLLLEEDAGFTVLSKNGVPIDDLVIYSREVGFLIEDVQDFYDKLVEDLRGDKIWSMWRDFDMEEIYEEQT